MKVRIKSLPKAQSGLDVRMNTALGQNHKAMPKFRKMIARINKVAPKSLAAVA